VITLLDATQEMYHKHADRPLITMSMGSLGVVSRVSGEKGAISLSTSLLAISIIDFFYNTSKIERSSSTDC
jgi:hypothetical protein